MFKKIIGVSLIIISIVTAVFGMPLVFIGLVGFPPATPIPNVMVIAVWIVTVIFSSGCLIKGIELSKESIY